MKPLTKPIKHEPAKPVLNMVQAHVEQPKSPDISPVIMAMTKSADDNAKLMREAIDKIITSKEVEPKKWVFDVERETDIHDANYGLLKRITAVAQP